MWIFWHFSLQKQCIPNYLSPQGGALVAPCVHVFLVVGLTLIFVFVSVHHHGRGDHPTGHRDHVHAPEDGVFPDPESGRGALAGAASSLVSWKVSRELLWTYLRNLLSLSWLLIHKANNFTEGTILRFWQYYGPYTDHSVDHWQVSNGLTALSWQGSISRVIWGQLELDPNMVHHLFKRRLIQS